MADRTQYYHEWYLKHKEQKKKNTYKWLERKKKELGEEGFKMWKKNENDKYRKRVGSF
jgi:hypothetical protein